MAANGKVSLNQKMSTDVHAALKAAAGRNARTIGLQAEFILRKWLIANRYLPATKANTRRPAPKAAQ